jgi:hypothetical protein
VSIAQPVVVFAVVPHLYAGALLTLALRRDLPLFGARFSLRRYYALMGWAPLAYLVLALAVDARYLAMLLVCGFAGVAGELIVSALWRGFFGGSIWTYSHGAFAAGFSSTINFLPWAVGAFLFHALTLFVGAGTWLRPLGLAQVVGWGIAALAGGALCTWPVYLALRHRHQRRAGNAAPQSSFRRLSPTGFAVFCFPIGCLMVVLGTLVDWRLVPLMLAFSVVGFVTEYGYGRLMSELFAQSLWRYNPWPVDGGHASFVSLPLWALGGLFFFVICEALMA